MSADTWIIHKINNASGNVTMLSDKGRKLDISLPSKHTTHETKQAYIDGHVSGHSSAISKSSIKSYSCYATIVIQLIVIAILLYLRVN